MIDIMSKITGRTIFIIDASGTILAASKPAKELLQGHKHPTSSVQTIFPGILDELLRELSQGSVLDFTKKNKNDEFSIIDLCNKTYCLEHKDVTNDYTRDKELVELRKMVRRVEELAALGDLVAQISHEVNTPLGICVTSASHAADKVEFLDAQFNKNLLTQSDMRESLRVAQQAIGLTNSNLARTSKIINGLRRLSKDTRRHDKEKLGLYQFTNNIIGQLQPLLEKQNVDVAITIPTNIVIYESPSSLSQVVSNLVMNSLRHGFPKHYVHSYPSITISAECKHDWVEITYCDNGIGIPDHIRPNIFEPFVSGSLDEASTGLGMSIIREIVHDSFSGEVDLPPCSTGFKLKFTMRCCK